MLCPKCPGVDLEPFQARPDLEIDQCPQCEGIWYDQSEVYQYVERPEQFYEIFKEVWKKAKPVPYACPRCKTKMVQATIVRARLPFEACPDCGGLWFDKGEVQQLNRFLDDWHKKEAGEEEVAVGPRAPEEVELDSLMGEDPFVSHTVLAVLGTLGLCMALFSTLRSAGGICLVSFLSLVVWLPLFLFRTWYFSNVEIFIGEVVRREALEGYDAEVQVEFVYEDKPLQITRTVVRGSRLDKEAGALIDVVVNPQFLQGAFIADLSEFKKGKGRTHEWEESERLRNMSPSTTSCLWWLKG
jgi:Zn-finger nucleic acid-binding protein